MDTQRISDEREITALLNRYARAVDSEDWALYRSLFTDDAHIDYSSAGAAATTHQPTGLSTRHSDGRTDTLPTLPFIGRQAKPNSRDLPERVLCAGETSRP